MALWRVTVEIPTSRKVVWRHRYAVIAASEADATARALELLSPQSDDQLTVTATPEPSGIFVVSVWVGRAGSSEVTP